MNQFIFIVTDREDVNGAPIDAYEIALARLQSNIWPLYKRTSHRKTVSRYDVCVIYVAGKGLAAHTFIAQATVSSLSNHEGTWREPANRELLFQIPAMLITFKDVIMYETPIDIYPLKAHLHFIGDTKFWGLHMQGGCKKISAEDFQLITARNYKSD